MGIMDVFKRQLSQVIQWEQQEQNILWEKFVSNNNDEIKNASKLIVSAGQGCVLVYEGKIVDVVGEGIFNLKTDNHPFITNLVKLRTQFESEHKLALYFYRTTQQLNQTWGTATPVKYQDPVYQMPVEVGFNGNLSFQIVAAKESMEQLFGAQTCYRLADVKKIIVGRISEYIAQEIVSQGYTYAEIDAHLGEISQSMLTQLNLELASLGIQLLDFKISGSVFDTATRQRISKMADISTDVLAANQAGINYAELEKLRALRDLAQNEGSGNMAGIGMEMGMGLALAKQFGSLTSNDSLETKLRQLKSLREADLISEEEFSAKKAELLSQV